MKQHAIRADVLPDRVHIDRRTRELNYVMREHHCHPYFELSCIERGSCRFLIENSIYDLRDGDLVLIPPQLLHYTRYLFGSCRRSSVYFRQEDLSETVAAQMPGGADFLTQLRIFQVPEAQQAQVCALLDRMDAEERLDDERTASMLQLQLQELFLLFGRCCRFLEDSPAEIHTTDRQILLAANFINEHFRQPITAADIAAAAGFSPNYLSRRFREAAGLGVHEYLVFIRLRNAAAELLSTDDSVTQIALRCGFSDSNYFKDVFKKKYGVTPREYRKQQ